MDAELIDLVARAQRGDPRAFAALIRRYERTALAVAYAQLGGDPTRAGDATQEAFVKAWQKLADLADPARFPAWLCHIVRNAAIDHRRRTKPAGPDLSDVSPIAPVGSAHDPVAQLDRSETRQQIGAALQSLDEVSRSAVVLRYYEGLSSKAIGDLLDLSPAAVDMRLTRARQELKKQLSGLMHDEPRTLSAPGLAT